MLSLDFPLLIMLLIFLCRFMDIGGWGMLNVWLAEAKKAENSSLLIELLLVS